MGLSERKLAVRQRGIFWHTPAATFPVIYEPYFIPIHTVLSEDMKTDFVNTLELSVIHEMLLNNTESILIHLGDAPQGHKILRTSTRHCA